MTSKKAIATELSCIAPASVSTASFGQAWTGSVQAIGTVY